MDIIFSKDPHRMNWIRQDFPYAEVQCPSYLHAEVQSTQSGDLTTTEIQITNPTNKPILTSLHDISISLPLEDRYEETSLCLTSRALVHLFCGNDVTYALALRMGGDPPHLGLVVTQGAFGAYSIRHNGPLANDRGCFLLHPSPLAFAPGETHVFSWIIFPHEGKEAFFSTMAKYHSVPHVNSDRYILFPGETANIQIIPVAKDDSVIVNGIEVQPSDGEYRIAVTPDIPGEISLQITAGAQRTWCRLLAMPDIESLAASRVHFIRDHQQYNGSIPSISGAYLAYDNDEETLILNPVNDENGGRERVGMGILMARYLSRGGKDPDGSLRRSLDRYADYVRRELVDPVQGIVYNDLGRDTSYLRNYNYPWFIHFFLELFYLTHNEADLLLAYTILERFYVHENGAHFYPIELPLMDLAHALSAEGLTMQAAQTEAYAAAHAEVICEQGIHYPPFEVAFEQSIIGPAADVCLQAYALTGTARYLEEAEKHLRILLQFNGIAPDYHLNEVAIRNWDGYWFGKWKIFGDTSPHYWSGITGHCLALYASLTGNEKSGIMAENCLRGILPLIFPDGRASCAYLYPLESNGVPCQKYDPRANDQDWGLYFYLRYLDSNKTQ